MASLISARLQRLCCRYGCSVTIVIGMIVGLGLSTAIQAAEPIRPDLTPRLQGLLKEEMLQIEQAMQEIYSAMLKGRHAEVAEKGQSIHDSFILDQSLTDEDRHALRSAVPQQFLSMDAYLHELAAMLAEAGRAEDSTRQLETYARMTESCVACHSAYVTDRFEGLEGVDIPTDWGKPVAEEQETQD
ncbi:cytochrome c [Billgrantia diversa]|uniref:cytochrome c n=1 Tax=Halomonas sp. MCCC 1A13316 TaxID=2733487 RepID=UPI0018A382CE|nr:cytochrome c [Halomonas sp. MCCC 1A13316]QOR38552.1 cytochrome c [Halomonas sp. MCCC 1A13316]